SCPPCMEVSSCDEETGECEIGSRCPPC
nr:Chain A, drp6 [synthetic construct]